MENHDFQMRLHGNMKCRVQRHLIKFLILIVADKTEHFCTSRDLARQASAQTMLVSSEWSSLVSFDAVFVDIFPLCNLTYLSLNYRPYYDVFLIPF